MEFFDDSPATRYFVDESVILSGGRSQDAETHEWSFTECIFYMGYVFEDKTVSIAIYDDSSRSYILKTVYVSDYLTAESLLKKINADYPGKIKVKNILAKCRVYFKAVEDSFFIQSKVTDYNESCDQCGDYNRDEFIFLYVPAIPNTPLNESSLAIHWEYGCFGGTKHSGVYDDVVGDVDELLARMEEAVWEAYQQDVAAARDVIAKTR